MKIKSKYWPIKFNGIGWSYDRLYRMFLYAYVYEWDETPYGFSITILGVDFNFLCGEWPGEE